MVDRAEPSIHFFVYTRLLVQLAQLRNHGSVASASAERLRDDMAAIFRCLTRREIDRLSRVSALYVLAGDGKI